MATFSLFFLPLLAYNLFLIKEILKSKLNEESGNLTWALVISVVILSTVSQFSGKLAWNRDFGLGTKEGVMAPIEFIKSNEIQGPFFNNYDIGGLMIFGLFPEEKVFVDNRPEAYPEEFFTEIYVPMQENEELWQREMLKNNFNAILFNRLDYTPWSQQFLISRVKDSSWAPVYIDNSTILFLYRNEDNRETIEQYELPKEMFNI